MERCLLSPAQFHYCDHLAAATVYLYAAELGPALDKMRTSLLLFVVHHGGNRYHETATRFWMIQVEKHLDRSLCLRESIARVITALAKKDLIHEYYSKEVLALPQAKQEWIEPDLK